MINVDNGRQSNFGVFVGYISLIFQVHFRFESGFNKHFFVYFKYVGTEKKKLTETISVFLLKIYIFDVKVIWAQTRL